MDKTARKDDFYDIRALATKNLPPENEIFGRKVDFAGKAGFGFV